MPRNRRWPPRRAESSKERGIAEGYRSGLEEAIAEELKALGEVVLYETDVIGYTKPSTENKYHPDFKLRNGIYLETKGRFLASDRKKHKLIKEQHPEIDIRFVFSNANARINKGSPTTNAMWADRHGFKWAHRHVPKEWINEPRRP
jgi:hypothetical protein